MRAQVLAKIDIYVNSATEFAHLGHFGTEIRTFLKFCDPVRARKYGHACMMRIGQPKMIQIGSTMHACTDFLARTGTRNFKMT